MLPKGNKGLTFRQAWFELLNGRKIKLPTWTGYWKWENYTIMIHSSDGTVIDIRETTNPAYTFTNIATNEWEILPDDYEINITNNTDSNIKEERKELYIDDPTTVNSKDHNYENYYAKG